MSFTKKAQAAIIAGLLIVGNAVPALAADPSVGSQTGTGSTDVTVIAKVSDGEYGGTSIPEGQTGYNPDISPKDNLGDNIAFTVPSAINFVADAQGNLTGPSASACYIENESVFAIRASSFDVDPNTGWTIVDKDDTTHTTANSADFQFGPSGSTIDARDYLTKANVTGAAWNMGAKSDADGATSDRVQMTSTGKIYNVSMDLTTQQKIATIKTYVSVGSA